MSETPQLPDNSNNVRVLPVPDDPNLRVTVNGSNQVLAAERLLDQSQSICFSTGDMPTLSASLQTPDGVREVPGLIALVKVYGRLDQAPTPLSTDIEVSFAALDTDIRDNRLAPEAIIMVGKGSYLPPALMAGIKNNEELLKRTPLPADRATYLGALGIGSELSQTAVVVGDAPFIMTGNGNGDVFFPTLPYDDSGMPVMADICLAYDDDGKGHITVNRLGENQTGPAANMTTLSGLTVTPNGEVIWHGKSVFSNQSAERSRPTVIQTAAHQALDYIGIAPALMERGNTLRHSQEPFWYPLIPTQVTVPVQGRAQSSTPTLKPPAPVPTATPTMPSPTGTSPQPTYSMPPPSLPGLYDGITDAYDTGIVSSPDTDAAPLGIHLGTRQSTWMEDERDVTGTTPTQPAPTNPAEETTLREKDGKVLGTFDRWTHRLPGR